MIKIIPKENRYFSDMGNMSSNFLFSFADYYDPLNQSFGKLRVFNDDYLGANSGFDFHPHSHYEILTLMLEGTITHKDSLGNEQKINEYEIQVTDTANGILHSEINHEPKPLKLYQIWFSPSKTSQDPIYYTAKYSKKDIENNLYKIASGIDDTAQNKLTTQIEIYRGIFDENKEINLEFSDYIFIYVTSGELEINGKKLGEKYQARIFGEEKINLKFSKKSEIIVIYSK